MPASESNGSCPNHKLAKRCEFGPVAAHFERRQQHVVRDRHVLEHGAPLGLRAAAQVDDAERAAITELLNVSLPSIRPRPQPALNPAKPALPGGATQNLALAKPTRQSSVRYFGAQGGVDGRVTGTFGFYTQMEPNPWWDVDLRQPSKISEIRIYNSKINPECARTLQVLLSDDGATWNRAYAHNGSEFGADGQPLRIPLKGVTARWVRVQLADTNYLHLDEIEVY